MLVRIATRSLTGRALLALIVLALVAVGPAFAQMEEDASTSEALDAAPEEEADSENSDDAEDSDDSDADSGSSDSETCYESEERRGTFKDCRSRFGARFALGLGIDNFASGELLKVLNPQVAADNDTRERFVGGFDVQYRLWHKQKEKKKKDKDGKEQINRNTKALWVRALTLHGVRSSEVDCTKDATDTSDGSTLPPVCSLQTNAFLPSDLDVGETATYILREASSLEAFGALRYEFRSLEGRGTNSEDKPSGVLYLAGQLGFLSVADSGDDLIDNHLLAIGAAATQGRFKNSFLEMGWGRTQLYGDKSDDRFKVRALVNWQVSDLPNISAFASIVVDSDFGSGSDSVQSYIGLSFDVSQLSTKKAKQKADKE